MEWVQIETGVFRTPTAEQFDLFRRIVNDPSKQPCYAACEVGMDRTGVYLGAHRMVDQRWSTADVAAEMKRHHQKVWWPCFRNYKGVINSYAASKCANVAYGAGSDAR